MASGASWRLRMAPRPCPGSRSGHFRSSPFPGRRVVWQILGEDHRALDDVLQLSNVPRPRIVPEKSNGAVAEPPDRLPELARTATHEVLHEPRNVIASIA